MKKKICLAISALFLFSAISTAAYAKDSGTQKLKTMRTTYTVVDPDTEH